MDDDEGPEATDRTSLGDFIASQRRAAELSLRQLAERAGISNPYISQIERGLRKPSAEVLNQIATALSVSAASLYVRAGILDPDEDHLSSTQRAINADPALTPAQKQALLQVYLAFRQADADGSVSAQPSPPPARPAHHEE